MANYVIGKIGKSFKFDKSKFKAPDGDIDGLNMVLILARHNPDDTFYIVGQNQWDALEIENKPKNVISVFKRDVDKLNKIEEDFYLKRMEGIDVKGGIFIDGISGIRYAQEKYSPHKRMNFAIRYVAPMIRYINDSGIKWTYVQTDPRQKMLTVMHDLFNMPSKVITQTVIKEKTQKIDRNGNHIEIDLDIPYLGAERISAYNFNVNKSFKFGQDELVIILNEGEPCLKRYELIKPYLTDDAIEQIVRLLDGWQGKLTWEALIDAIVTRLHCKYTRQALHKHERIRAAYAMRKQTLGKGKQATFQLHLSPHCC